MGVEETQLEAAIAAAEATAQPTDVAPVDKVAAQTQDPAATKAKVTTIPYDRFQAVVEQKNNAFLEMETLRTQLDQRTAELGRAVDLIQTKDRDAQLVAEIRRLSENPKWRDTIERLDKAVRGIEDDVEEGKVSETKGDERVFKEIEKAKAEMREQLADTQAETLLDRANTMAREYMANLPDQYTDEDKRVISRLLVDTIDWDGIEAQPTNLANFVAAGFQEAINVNGTPRGIERAAITTSNQESVKEKDALNTLLSAEWGKTREVDRGGKTIREPIVNDGDFTKALAAVMRESRA